MYLKGKVMCYKGGFFFKSPINSVKSRSKSAEDFFSVKLDKMIPKFIWARKCTRIGNEGQGFGRWEGPVRGKGVCLSTQKYLKVKIVFNMCRQIGHLNKIGSPETD